MNVPLSLCPQSYFQVLVSTSGGMCSELGRYGIFSVCSLMIVHSAAPKARTQEVSLLSCLAFISLCTPIFHLCHTCWDPFYLQNPAQTTSIRFPPPLRVS